MGAAMAGRLARHGFPVTVYNRTPTRADDVARVTGAATAATAAAAAEHADVVIVSLADDDAVSSTYAGDLGLAAGLTPGTVVLETSTIAPATVRALAPLVAGPGAMLLDAPVSGSVSVVEQGELTFMIGGDDAGLARARPVLEALSARVFHLGPVGTGAIMKLAVNSVVHALNQALSEALVLAEKAGVDRAAAYEVFAASAVAAPFVRYKMASFLRPDETPVAFKLDLVAKDLDLAADLADEVGARMDQLATNRRVVQEALRAGYGERDLSAIAELLRAPAGAPTPADHDP
jgi:3-hydroxyisobutyrate dehydrogenase/2-hydroxy-3-oxopropionate reductase